MQPVQAKTRVIALDPPVEFVALIDGERLNATVTHYSDDSPDQTFRVSFGDGYGSTFVLDKVSGAWSDKTGLEKYAQGIAADLRALAGLDRNNYRYAFWLTGIETEGFTVWVVPERGKRGAYGVYYKGHYRFLLERTPRWEYSTGQPGLQVNPRIASAVCKFIDDNL